MFQIVSPFRATVMKRATFVQKGSHGTEIRNSSASAGSSFFFCGATQRILFYSAHIEAEGDFTT